MSVLEEARVWLEKMKDHTDCCGTPMVRTLVAYLEPLENIASLVACVDFDAPTEHDELLISEIRKAVAALPPGAR